MDNLDGLPAVAREAIRASLGGQRPALPSATGVLRASRPVFVTLRIDGELRGCIGALEAGCRDLIAETADRAVAAAIDDPRFVPLGLDELDRCQIEVSVLGSLEPIRDLTDLDPRRYGVVVGDALGRRGVLLPDIPGVENAEQQIAIARRKAGIPEGTRLRLWRFAVDKVADPSAGDS